jgi:large subunit ribosomal protein L29
VILLRASEIRELTDDELDRKLDESRQELFNLRFQHATGALENPAALHRAKRDIARLLTLAHQRAATQNEQTT